MKILAINGSPRINWNTATLLRKALDGAASQGAQVEMIHLYDINYSGCTSCYSCKRTGSQHRCMLHDDLYRVLEKMSRADGLIFGSPVIFGSVSSGMAACLERFLFPYILYGYEVSNTGGHQMPSAFIFTEDAMKKKFGYELQGLSGYEMIIKKVLGEDTEMMDFNDSHNFANCRQCQNTECKMYGRSDDTERAEDFPRECQDAYMLGVRVAQKALAKNKM